MATIATLAEDLKTSTVVIKTALNLPVNVTNSTEISLEKEVEVRAYMAKLALNNQTNKVIDLLDKDPEVLGFKKEEVGMNLDTMDRSQLITLANETGVVIDPTMDEAEIRRTLKDEFALRYLASQSAVPVTGRVELPLEPHYVLLFRGLFLLFLLLGTVAVLYSTLIFVLGSLHSIFDRTAVVFESWVSESFIDGLILLAIAGIIFWFGKKYLYL
jgi:hypothetical protein